MLGDNGEWWFGLDGVGRVVVRRGRALALGSVGEARDVEEVKGMRLAVGVA